MSDTQIRDEALTLITAGHETTANGLSWTWYLLAQHPEVEARFHDELAEMVGERALVAEDAAALPYTQAVLLESMRLYPPAWGIERRALRDQEIGGYVIPAGAAVLMPTFVVNRDPRLYPDPLRFDPDRFLGEVAARPPRLGVPAVRSGHAQVHRRRLRHAGGGAGAGRAGPPLAAAARSGHGRWCRRRGCRCALGTASGCDPSCGRREHSGRRGGPQPARGAGAVADVGDRGGAGLDHLRTPAGERLLQRHRHRVRRRGCSRAGAAGLADLAGGGGAAGACRRPAAELAAPAGRAAGGDWRLGCVGSSVHDDRLARRDHPVEPRRKAVQSVRRLRRRHRARRSQLLRFAAPARASGWRSGWATASRSRSWR